MPSLEMSQTFTSAVNQWLEGPGDELMNSIFAGLINEVTEANQAYSGSPIEQRPSFIIDGRIVTNINKIDLFKSKKITTIWSFALAVMLDFLQAANTLSPSVSGEYQRSFALLDENDTVIGEGDPLTLQGALLSRPEGYSYTLVNFAPYARNLEPLWGGKHGVSSGAPNGIFEQTISVVQAKYKRRIKLSTMYFTFRNHPELMGSTRQSPGPPYSILPTLVTTSPRYRPRSILPK